MIKCCKCDEEIENDFMVEFGILSPDRAMCEDCKQDLGKKIEEAMRMGFSPFRNMECHGTAKAYN